MHNRKTITNAPLFLMGCPRSGTTMLLHILASHEQLAWVSSYCNRFPNLLFLSLYNRIFRIPLIGKRIIYQRDRSYFIPFPVEPWNFWNYYLQNFQWTRNSSQKPRRRDPSDMTSQEIRSVSKAIHKICHYQGSPRFLSKYTDFPRMSYLSTAFQNAKFVHLIRDGRAVVYSLMQKMESGQFHTWEERHWWISGWPQSWQVRWESEHHSQLGLAAFLWKFFTSEIRKEAEEFPALSYMEIQYEKLIESPIETTSKILSFANLPPSKFLTDYLNQIKPQRNMNLKWQKAFSNEQKDEINSIFEFCDNNQF